MIYWRRAGAARRAARAAQRLRRALHPHAEGKSALGTDIRDHRRAPPGVAGVPRHLQRHLADRATRVHHARGIPAKPALISRQDRIGFNPVSQKPRAVQRRSCSRTKPGSDSRARTATFARRLAHVRPWCGTTAMRPLTCSARFVRHAASGRTDESWSQLSADGRRLPTSGNA